MAGVSPSLIRIDGLSEAITSLGVFPDAPLKRLQREANVRRHIQTAIDDLETAAWHFTNQEDNCVRVRQMLASARPPNSKNAYRKDPCAESSQR